jgi:hypothetical protein
MRKYLFYLGVRVLVKILLHFYVLPFCFCRILMMVAVDEWFSSGTVTSVRLEIYLLMSVIAFTNPSYYVSIYLYMCI